MTDLNNQNKIRLNHEQLNEKEIKDNLEVTSL